MDVSEFEGRTPVNAALGAVVTTVVLLVWPLTVGAPALGGLLAGYLQREKGAGGMKAGAAMGGLMVVPAVALAVIAQGILSSYMFVGPMLSQYLPVAVVLIVGYSVVLGVVGGLLGGQIAGGPSAADGGSGQSSATSTGTSGRQTADSSSRRSTAGGSSSDRSALEKMKGESSDGGGSGRSGGADTPAGSSGATAPACPDCGHESPDPNAQFCANCGAELGVGCPDCGADLQPDAAYCPNCGAAVEDGSDAGTGGQSTGGSAGDRGDRQSGAGGGQPTAGAGGRSAVGGRGADGSGRGAGGSTGSDEHDIQKVEHDDGSVTAHCGGCRAEVRETARTCPDCGATLRNVVFVDADEFR